MAEKEIYLKLTEDEADDVICALMSQWRGGDNINITGEENDELICKINCQKDSICRPYVVIGVHDDGRQYLKKRVVVMAESAKLAIEYAKEKLERTSEDVFKVNPEDVHEMRDDEFSVEVL